MAAPNQSLQQTPAAIPVFWTSMSPEAAGAAELGRSAKEAVAISMGLLDDARDALCQGEYFPLGWTFPLVAALGADGPRLSIVCVRRSLRRLLPFTEDEWQRNLLLPELERLEQYETHPPTREELQARLAYLHQIFHQGAQPAVNNLFVAWMHSRYSANNNFAKNQEFALGFMLRATGNRPEHREIIIEEFQRVAAEARSVAESGSPAGRPRD